MPTSTTSVFSLTLQPQVTLEGLLILDLSHRPQGWRQHRIRELIAAGIGATPGPESEFDICADGSPFRIRVRLDPANSSTDAAAWNALQAIAPIRRPDWIRRVLLDGLRALQSGARPPAPVQIIVPATVQAPPVTDTPEPADRPTRAPDFQPLNADVKSKLRALFS